MMAPTPYEGSEIASDDSWWDDNYPIDTEEKKPVEIAERETQDVWRLKLALLLVLVCAAVAVSLSTYFYIAAEENEKFEERFEEDSKKIFEAIGTSLDNTLGVFDNAAVALVTHARFANQTWPFVTMPNFALRMAKLLAPSAVVAINLMPIVTSENRAQWEAYTRRNDDWVNESMEIQTSGQAKYYGPKVLNGARNGVIHGDFAVIPANVSRIMLPTWQNFPVTTDPTGTYTYNYDWASTTVAGNTFVTVEKHKAAFSKTYMIPKPGDTLAEAETKAWGEAFRPFVPPEEESIEPISDFTYPIVDAVDAIQIAGTKDYNPDDRKVVGILGGAVYWRALIRNILPEGSDGIRVVFTCPCNEPFTYQINGPIAKYMGVGDFHDKKYDGMGKHSRLYDLKEYAVLDTGYSGAMIDQDFCPIALALYPSDDMKERYTSNDPIIFSVAAILIFLFTSFVFFLYDWSVERRQQTVMTTAVNSTAIVASLFPSIVRHRLYPETVPPPTRKSFLTRLSVTASGHTTAPGQRKSFVARRRILHFLNKGQTESSREPIAVLYSETTVLFADIAGFTAWSSERQPTQVFHLLETIFAAFDKLAKEHGVFKLGTIGDAYVAVVGLPTPRKHHAAVMARFAAECRAKMNELTVQLEATLGPGTNELALRFGLHSGPTTAGVLRGDKSRFELFGDTVNTASRMESNGERNKIQVSQQTAELIKLAGKGHWLARRNEKVNCKGKGLMTTYWCEPSMNPGSELHTTESRSSEFLLPCSASCEKKHAKLINWNVDLLQRLVTEIVANRRTPNFAVDVETAERGEVSPDEMYEQFDDPPSASSWERVEFSSAVETQLRELVNDIARLCRKAPFHNFDQGSHTAMAVTKLLDGMLSCHGNPETDIPITDSGSMGAISDPLARLAIVFTALIHNIETPRNAATRVADLEETSVDVNVVDIAWRLLMESKFDELRRCLFTSEVERDRFRQVLLKGVCAADSTFCDVQSRVEEQWKRIQPQSSDCTSRSTTYIIELVIQASVVSYAMQHFSVYDKWNNRLLTEEFHTYQSGDIINDPLEIWYQGQLSFFDTYVIPLAQRLKDCGVFGAVSDECLTYARDNRADWEAKGLDIIEDAAVTLSRLRTTQ